MSATLYHIVLVSTLSMLVACGDEGPCLEGGADGECVAGGDTGEPTPEGCALDPEFTVGGEFTCQGQGTGWLVTDIYGLGANNPVTSCLVYNDPLNIPEFPSADDCASIPLSLIPNNIPTPTACCTEGAPEASIIGTCELDCGFAACKTAIAAIRASADALVAPPGLEDVYDTSRADLYAYADVLEAPASLAYCASKVAGAPGDIVSVGMGPGPSSAGSFGHIKDATLFLSCGLDPNEPYVANPEAGECTEPTNIPAMMGQQQSGGVIHAGAITVTGPGVNTVASIHNASATTREVLNRDMSVEFTLLSFDADVLDAAAGSFAFRGAHISLAAPASGTLKGNVVTFAPGMLRFVLTAEVLIDGESLFGGLPVFAEYGNASPATVIRGLDGAFEFVDATFVIGEYMGVLDTEPSILTRIR